MARYIDADKLGVGKADRNAFIVPEYADGWNSAIEIISNAPTADVAPKSEVAREIVGFIEGKIKDMEDHTPTEELDRAIGLVNWILLGVIDEIEKRYAEEPK